MLPELSLNNHFKFGYDRDWFSLRTSPEQKWTVQYGLPIYPVQSFHEECLNTAAHIAQSTSQKITVLFSGGVDSEVALRSFVEKKIPVTATVLSFKNNLNAHDIYYAKRTCQQLGVPLRLLELDVLRFWEEQLMNYAEPTYCTSPQLLTTMWLVDQVDEYPVIGSGECLIVRKNPSESKWVLVEKEKIASWYRHFLLRNRSGCPGFFQYTPYLIYAYMRDPHIQKLISTENKSISSSDKIKLEFYKQHFNLEDRPKYTGFENLQTEDAHYRKILNTKFHYANSVFETEVSHFFKGATET